MLATTIIAMSAGSVGALAFLGVVGFVALTLFVSAAFTVEQQTRSIVERFGKFKEIAAPGLNWKIPFIDRVAGVVSHRVQELEIDVESKTKDDVFVDLKIAVQFFVGENDDAVMAAYYKLTQPKRQISSYVFDTVRAVVPDMLIDSVFSEKERIATAVKERLGEAMERFGYTILQALVNDIQPDPKVKTAMNEVNASARLMEAAKNEAEAQKIRVIAAAEGDARAKELQGIGIARQRLAIARGLKESVEACSEAGISSEEATRMVLLTQHYDTVTAVGARSKATIMMLPYAPDGMAAVGDQLMSALLVRDEAAAPSKETGRPPKVARTT